MDLKNIMILIITVVACASVYLYLDLKNNLIKYRQDKDTELQNKENELNKREINLIQKENCVSELTKYRKFHQNLLQILSENSLSTSLPPVSPIPPVLPVLPAQNTNIL